MVLISFSVLEAVIRTEINLKTVLIYTGFGSDSIEPIL